MIDCAHLIGGLPVVCRSLLQIGIGLALQSTLLLAAGLLAGRWLRRLGPAASAFVYQATLVSLVLGALLAMPFGGRFAPLWAIALPPAQEVAGVPVVPDIAGPGARVVRAPSPPMAGEPAPVTASSATRAQPSSGLPFDEG